MQYTCYSILAMYNMFIIPLTLIFVPESNTPNGLLFGTSVVVLRNIFRSIRVYVSEETKTLLVIQIILVLAL
jgi:hypothetical protein